MTRPGSARRRVFVGFRVRVVILAMRMDIGYTRE